MRNTKYKKYGTTFLTVCAVIFSLTAMANAAVNPELISKAPNGGNGNNSSSNASVSADGRYVVFSSLATNLVNGITDTNNAVDIFLRDTQTGITRCLSCVSAANPTSTGNGNSLFPIITPDGRYVVFNTFATDLVGGIDTNNAPDVVLYDTQLNQRVLVSVVPSGAVTGNDSSGAAVNGRANYAISDDGRYVVFGSNASNLTASSDTNNKYDLFVRDMQMNSTREITLNSSGNAGNLESFDPSISADGQIIAYTSNASDLLPASNDNNGNADVFVYNYEDQTTKGVSLRRDSVNTANNSSFSAVISKNGSQIVYSSNANNLTGMFLTSAANTFVYNVGSRQNSLVSINSDGTNGANRSSSLDVSISYDGRYITFASSATNLSPLTVTADISNVFRRDLFRGKTEVVSVTPAGAASTRNSFSSVMDGGISRDGRFIVFRSLDGNLEPGFPLNQNPQVYVRDMLNGITTVLALSNAGTELSDAASSSASISANGKAAFFLSLATNLTPTNTNGFINVFKAKVPTPQSAVSDFDGDGKTDYAVWRPTTGYWYVLPNSGNYLASSIAWGMNGDQIVPSHYSGDGRTDYAVFRPSNGTWYITDSATFGAQTVVFGQSGDKPVPADYNGDGKADVAVFRPSTGFWYIARTTGVPAQNFEAVQFGLSTDIPVAGDFDGDGKADIAVYRPSNGFWYILRSTNGQVQSVQFGNATDKPVTGDFDGDGKTDIAVFRSGVFYILESRTGNSRGISWGFASDIPVIGDYDGDGKADVAIFRPSTGGWSVVRSSANSTFTIQFGQNGDALAPAAFNQ